MSPNPPIRGHELISEGAMRITRGLDGTDIVTGGCRCGAKPPMNGEYLPFKGAVKRWHRAHKEDVRTHHSPPPSDEDVRAALVDAMHGAKDWTANGLADAILGCPLLGKLLRGGL